MKKILYIHHSTGIGGASISLVNLIDNLDRSKFEPHVLLLKESDVCELLKSKGISFSIADGFFYKKIHVPFIHILPSWFSVFNPVKAVYFFMSFVISRFVFSRILLAKYDFDVLHLNSLTLIDFLHANNKYKSLIHIREPISVGHLGLRKKIFEHIIDNNADSVIAISKDNLERLNLDRCKKEVVYNWTKVPEFMSFNKKNNHDLSLLYLGGGAAFKGYELLKNTLPLIRPNVKVLCAGFYEQKQIEELSNYKNVEFLGLITDVDCKLRESYLLLNIFVDDHFARPIIEAYANATTVIATPLNGTLEIVEHNVDGYIIDDISCESLANAIHKLLDSECLVEYLSKNAYDKAKKIFSEKNIMKIEKAYE